MSTGRRIFPVQAREGKARVRELYADLKARGLDPWLDDGELASGQIWTGQIPKAIRQAGVFFRVCPADPSARSANVQNEFRRALSVFGERPPGSSCLIPHALHSLLGQ